MCGNGSGRNLNYEHPEIWLPVPTFTELYEVSSLGRVRSICKRQGTKVGRILKQRLAGPPNKERYYVRLCHTASGFNKSVSVHRLVASAFLGPCPNGMEVNHIDGNRYNNFSCNLEYVTPHENTLHSMLLGLKKQNLSFDDVRLIRRLLRTEKPAAVARRLKIGIGVVCNIRSGRTYSWLPDLSQS